MAMWRKGWLWLLLGLLWGEGGWPERQRIGIDVVLAIDASKSMLRTDPHNLRHIGAKEFLDLVDLGDQVGLLEFGETVTIHAPLTPLRNEATREALKRMVDSITSSGDWTHIPAAVEAAYTLLQQGHNPRHQQYLLLLTDGETDLPGGPPQERAALERLHRLVLPAFRKRGWVIYTVGLTREADRALMEAIVRATRRRVGLKEKGFHAQTPTAREIPSVYTRILAQMVDWVEVGDPQERNAYRFHPSWDERGIIIVERPPTAQTELEGPDGKRWRAEDAAGSSSLRWSKGEGYDVIILSPPQSGRYRVQVQGGEGRTQGYAESDLWLFLAPLPSRVAQGEPVLLTSRLLRGEQPLSGREEPLQGATVEALLTLPDGNRLTLPLRDDGTAGDAQAQDGEFSAFFVPPSQGTYLVRSALHSPSLDRYSEERTFSVEGPAWVLLQTDRPLYRPGEAILLLGRLTPYARFAGEPLFRLQVLRPDRRQDRLDLFDDGQHGDEKAKDGLFAHRYTDTHQAGVYGFLAEVAGPTREGMSHIARAFVTASVGAPGIRIEPTSVEVGRLVAGGTPSSVRLRAFSLLDYPEQLRLEVAGVEGVPREALQVRIRQGNRFLPVLDLPAKGSRPFDVLLETTHRKPALGRLWLKAVPEKTQVFVEPEQVEVTFEVKPPPPWWRLWAFLLALLALAAVLIGLGAQWSKPSLMGFLEILHPGGEVERVRLRNRGFLGLRRSLWLGTAPACDIRLPAASGLQPRHARLYRRRIAGRHRLVVEPWEQRRLFFLKHGDEMELGPLRLRYDNFRDR